MNMSLTCTGAFASVSLMWVLEFHLSPHSTPGLNHFCWTIQSLEHCCHLTTTVFGCSIPCFTGYFLHTDFFTELERRLLRKLIPPGCPLAVRSMSQTNHKRRHQNGPSSIDHLKSTTSVLTATQLVYVIGAGVTAAAGTRLALQ